MAFPPNIQIQNGRLPDTPGVYLYYDVNDTLLYVGKATSLKKRVSSYFNKTYQKADDTYARRIGKMVSEIVRIDYIETPTVIEALVLEANLVRARHPKYNVLLTDDRSFLYLVITREAYPRPLLKRGLELAREGIHPFQSTEELPEAARRRYMAVYGPFTSPNALRKALEVLRRIFPWSVCQPPEVTGKRRPCFDAQLRKCPGVCTGAITSRAYRKAIRGLMQVFEGKVAVVMRRLEREMQQAAERLEFEEAEQLKRRLYALKHIRDVSVITQDFSPLPYEHPDKGFINALGRVEAFDISNISGTHPVGSMTVFLDGKPAPSAYRRFRIKTVEGPNDVAMMKEVITRRLRRAEQYPAAWGLPDVMVIDGGKPQVNAVQEVLNEAQVYVPIVGLAKGPDRKQDVLIYNHEDAYLSQIVHAQKPLFQRVRDEAHRFAVAYHRSLRSQDVRKRTRSRKRA